MSIRSVPLTRRHSECKCEHPAFHSQSADRSASTLHAARRRAEEPCYPIPLTQLFVPHSETNNPDGFPMSDVAVIQLHNPPVNALSHPLRLRIAQELAQAEANPAVKAVVLTGGPEFFSGGADVKEFNTPKMSAEPSLATLIRLFEHSAKPTIAA